MWNLVDSKAKSGDLIGAKRLWLDHPLFGPAREQAGVAAHLREMVQDYSGWHWLHADPGVAPDPPAINRLDMIHVPTLVVVGERDLPDILSIANALTSGINGADQVAIPDVGHMTNMEAPAKFNDLLLNFLTS
jgi:pimeloyl-ACP methyl ester carboxylesterase